MGEPQVYFTSARVIGQLRPGTIDVVVRPDRYDLIDADSMPALSTEVISVELFPMELRAPNTDIWILTQYSDSRKMHEHPPTVKILPRTGYSYPDGYKPRSTA